jgi:hypothetical protein
MCLIKKKISLFQCTKGSNFSFATPEPVTINFIQRRHQANHQNLPFEIVHLSSSIRVFIFFAILITISFSFSSSSFVIDFVFVYSLLFSSPCLIYFITYEIFIYYRCLIDINVKLVLKKNDRNWSYINTSSYICVSSLYVCIKYKRAGKYHINKCVHTRQ